MASIGFLGQPAMTDMWVAGERLSLATVSGGRNVVVDLEGAVGPSGEGLTSVILDGFTGASATLSGAPPRLLMLQNIMVESAVTIVDNPTGQALAVFLEKVGYADAKASVPVKVSVADARASRVSIFSNDGDNALTLFAPAATSLLVNGDARLLLDMNAAINTNITSISATGSSGDMWLQDLGSFTRAIATGAGADRLTLTAATVADNLATIANESAPAEVQAGSGNDTVTLRTTGNGRVNLDTGANDDLVTLASRSGAENLQIMLGTGDDRFIVTGGAITSSDNVNAGGGTDFLNLNAVTAANAPAFTGFEWFNAAGIDSTVNMAWLRLNATKVIYADGAVGAAAKVINLGAGTEAVVQTDMARSMLGLSMAIPAALTVRVDIDESGEADTAIDTGAASLSLSNASSVHIAFQSDFLGHSLGEPTVGDNLIALKMETLGATRATVSSGGIFASNALNYIDAGNTLGSITIVGTQKLELAIARTSVTLIDAAAHTGGLAVSTASIGKAGLIKLGIGVDVVSVAATSTSTTFASVEGIEKAGAASLAGSAAERAVAIADADTLVFAGGQVASAASVSGGVLSASGVLSFTGAAPISLQAAFAIADLAAKSTNDVLVFSYQNHAYVFQQGGVTDIVVKLVGVTGVTDIAETGTDAFFIV